MVVSNQSIVSGGTCHFCSTGTATMPNTSTINLRLKNFFITNLLCEQPGGDRRPGQSEQQKAYHTTRHHLTQRLYGAARDREPTKT